MEPATRTLCLIQVAGRHATYLIDALEMPDLAPLAQLLSNQATTKVIHNAIFGREVLGLYAIDLPVRGTWILRQARDVNDRALLVDTPDSTLWVNGDLSHLDMMAKLAPSVALRGEVREFVALPTVLPVEIPVK